MKFRAIVEKDENGVYVATVPDLPSCSAEGKTKQELKKNVKEAIQAYIASLKEHGELVHVDIIMPESIPTHHTKTITLLTGNPRKKEALERASDLQKPKLDVIFDTKKIWLPEIQESDPSLVAKFAAEYGAAKLGRPVIKMDTGMFTEGLKGFPGAFVHYVDEKLGADGFLDLCRNLKNRRAHIKTALAYCEPGKNPVVFDDVVDGEIVKKARSMEGSFIDIVFVPYHKENKSLKTIGEIRVERPDLLGSIWGDTETKFLNWLKKDLNK